jgi:hypothetical protein
MTEVVSHLQPLGEDRGRVLAGSTSRRVRRPPRWLYTTRRATRTPLPDKARLQPQLLASVHVRGPCLCAMCRPSANSSAPGATSAAPHQHQSRPPRRVPQRRRPPPGRVLPPGFIVMMREEEKKRMKKGNETMEKKTEKGQKKTNRGRTSVQSEGL